jgi:hypothetical protein
MVRITRLCALGLTLVSGSAMADDGPEHRVRQTPPIQLGTSGGSASDRSGAFCCGGTLGALVVRDGVLCILSNNHVLARSGSASSGEDTVQPGLIDSNCSANTSNIVGDFAGNIVPLGSANVDTALSIVRPGMVNTSGAILDIGVPCASPQTPVLNLPVMKSGRTTGYSTGQITSLNTSVQIQYQAGCNQGRRFNITYTNQIVTTAMSAGGDSGSVLFSNDGTPNPVGLLFAGSSTTTIHNPIQQVINAYTAGGHTFSFVGNQCSSLVEPPVLRPPAAAYDNALRVKVQHEQELMARAGVWGVGVGSAERNPLEAVIVIYAEKTVADLPNQLDGVNVRVILTDPIVAQ